MDARLKVLQTLCGDMGIAGNTYHSRLMRPYDVLYLSGRKLDEASINIFLRRLRWCHSCCSTSNVYASLIY